MGEWPCHGTFLGDRSSADSVHAGVLAEKGVNEIIVLDLKGPKEATIVGLDKPILDMLRVAVPETHRKQGKPLNWRRKHR